jgi:ParB/RepB/Spo0J family partition protein
MPVTAAAAVPAAGELKQIPLMQLGVNPLNPRKTIDADALNELIATIDSAGILQPLLVRPASEGAEFPRYEIVAGHRRFAAATRLTLAGVPCIVRAMTDAEAADAAIIDNLQRVDVPPMEEAEAFGDLLARHGGVEAVAAAVGKDVAHVAKRLKLRTLGVFQCDALRQKLITVDHALLLARLGVEEQNTELKWCLDRDAGVKVSVEAVIADSVRRRKDQHRHHSWEPQSVLALKGHIEQNSGRKLSRAPWDLDDAGLLPQAGSCTLCPQNTKANLALFEDLNISAATCSDGRCFEIKREKFVQLKLAHAGMPPGSAIKLSWKATSTEPRMEIDDLTGEAGKTILTVTKKVKLNQTFKVGQWIEAKKGSCPNVLTGVTVDWSDSGDRGYMGSSEKLKKPGQSLLVCVAAKCKAHRKEWEKPKTQNTNSGYDRKAEEEKAEKKRLAALAETKLRVRLAGEAIDGVKKLSEKLLRNILIERLPRGSELEAVNAVCPGLRKLLETAKFDSVEFARAVATVSFDARTFEVWHHWEPTQFRKEFIQHLKELGYDASKAWDKPKVEKPVAKKEDAKPAAVNAAPAKPAKKKQVLSAAGRKRIADAIKKRWPKAKGGAA